MTMRKIGRNEFMDYSGLAETAGPARVYPRSVVRGVQSGEIYADGSAVLIWHRCGFAWLLGEYGEAQLREIDRLRTGVGRRLVLFTEDEKAMCFFENRGADIGRRLFFEYHGGSREVQLPKGFQLQEIDSGLFRRLSGRVVPGLFWSEEEYLKAGIGFCVMQGSEPAAWAFTASADGREVDIGVETAEAHRGKGLAYAAASAVIGAVLAAGMKPVWVCDGANKASRRLALKLGFESAGEWFRVR